MLGVYLAINQLLLLESFVIDFSKFAAQVSIGKLSALKAQQIDQFFF